MRFAIYDATGRITKISNVNADMIDMQLSDGESYIDAADGLDSTHYVDHGAMVPMPPQPSPNHIFEYGTKTWIDPRTPATQWPLIRAERARRLAACDWTQLPDVPLTTREAWAAYRQALRDITLQTDPFSIVWPISPA